MGLYDEVRELASKKGVTIYRIEKDLSFSNGVISKWNQSMPTSDNLLKVAKYLDTTVEELIGSSSSQNEKGNYK